MPIHDWRLAAGLEPAVRPEAAVLVGGSDLDEAEVEALKRHPILHVNTHEMTMPDAAGRVRAAIRPRAGEAEAWYLHIDLDVGGPEVCPGGLTPAAYWPPSEHIVASAKASAQTMPVKVASLAVYNPSADVNGNGAQFGLDMAMAIVDGITNRQ